MTPRTAVDDIARLQVIFASAFSTRTAAVIATRGRFVVGLPGGSVASAFFPVLAGLAIDWTRVEMFWIDERAVPPDHPDSNYGVASRLLLEPARIPAARVHRMHGELPDLDQAARRATDELRSIAGDPPRLDLVLVGVGEDGHVASIFNAAAELPPSEPVRAVYHSPKPPSRRLTMTLSVLAQAGLVVVAAFGASKAQVMREALADRDAATPVARLLQAAASSLVLLDREAGLS